MLRWLRRSRATATPTTPTPADLRIRDLLDDPALRRAMGLDADPAADAATTTVDTATTGMTTPSTTIATPGTTKTADDTAMSATGPPSRLGSVRPSRRPLRHLAA